MPGEFAVSQPLRQPAAPSARQRPLNTRIFRHEHIAALTDFGHFCLELTADVAIGRAVPLFRYRLAAQIFQRFGFAARHATQKYVAVPRDEDVRPRHIANAMLEVAARVASLGGVLQIALCRAEGPHQMWRERKTGALAGLSRQRRDERVGAFDVVARQTVFRKRCSGNGVPVRRRARPPASDELR